MQTRIAPNTDTFYAVVGLFFYGTTQERLEKWKNGENCQNGINGWWKMGPLRFLHLKFNPLSPSVALSICCANQLTGFYMRAKLALNGLNLRNWLYPCFFKTFKCEVNLAEIMYNGFETIQTISCHWYLSLSTESM